MKKSCRALILLFSFLIISPIFSQSRISNKYFGQTRTFKALVFSKTAVFRHDSIADVIAAIQNLGSQNDFVVEATEDANDFSDANLAQYQVVIFLNTTGDVLNGSQQAAFERYIQAGGGFVGIHSAADTEYGWSWYGGLVGAYFQNHPAIQTATIKVADRVHPSTTSLPALWERTDEWYNFQTNPRGKVHVLAALDENTYSGGESGFDHPITWCHEYDGGRAWYTAGGHTGDTYSETLYLEHLLGGIEFAAGVADGDCGATIEENFKKVVLDDDVLDPMELAVANDGRVFYVERPGAVKIYKLDVDNTVIAGQVSVTTVNEDGLLGLTLDPDFDNNNWLYLFYSPEGTESKQHLSRFTLAGDVLDMNSEKILLEVATQREQIGHSGGSLSFDQDGNLLIAVGDDTNPFDSDGYAPIDERSGRSAWDAQFTSANSNDLRGKILRITPQPDGTYTIPDGNLFPNDGSAGRPELTSAPSR